MFPLTTHNIACEMYGFIFAGLYIRVNWNAGFS